MFSLTLPLPTQGEMIASSYREQLVVSDSHAGNPMTSAWNFPPLFLLSGQLLPIFIIIFQNACCVPLFHVPHSFLSLLFTLSLLLIVIAIKAGTCSSAYEVAPQCLTHSGMSAWIKRKWSHLEKNLYFMNKRKRFHPTSLKGNLTKSVVLNLGWFCLSSPPTWNTDNVWRRFWLWQLTWGGHVVISIE